MKVRFWGIVLIGKHHHAIKNNSTFILVNLLLLLFSSIVVAQPINSSANPRSNYNFSPATSIFFVIIVIVFFLVGCLSICFSQFISRSDNPRRRVFRIINGVNQRSRRSMDQGLEPDVIDTFPTFLYSDVKRVRTGKDNGVLECSICLNEFKDEENLRLIPKCCHVFHPECIDMWLISNVTCPVCRADLVPAPGETEPGPNNCSLSSHFPDDYPTPPSIRLHEERVIEVHVDDNSDTTIELDSSSEAVTKSIEFTSIQKQPLGGKFPRSHSTGHSLIRHWNEYERFTLRLPEDVQKKLLSTMLVRDKNNLVFPNAMSPKTGYRSSSAGHDLPIHLSCELFDHEGRLDRRGSTVGPPFFTRSHSVEAPKQGHNSDNITISGSSVSPLRSPYDWLFGGTSSKDEAGERSFARLIGKSQV